MLDGRSRRGKSDSPDLESHDQPWSAARASSWPEARGDGDGRPPIVTRAPRCPRGAPTPSHMCTLSQTMGPYAQGAVSR